MKKNIVLSFILMVFAVAFWKKQYTFNESYSDQDKLSRESASLKPNSLQDKSVANKAAEQEMSIKRAIASGEEQESNSNTQGKDVAKHKEESVILQEYMPVDSDTPTGITREHFRKYNLYSRPVHVDYDEYYVSKNLVHIPHDQYSEDLGVMFEKVKGHVVYAPAEGKATDAPPVVVNSNTGEVEFPTGKVVVKAPGMKAQDINSTARQYALVVSETHPEIHTYFLTPKGKVDLFKIANTLSQLPGVEYSIPEIIPGWQVPF